MPECCLLWINIYECIYIYICRCELASFGQKKRKIATTSRKATKPCESERKMEGGDAYSRFERSNGDSTAFNFLHLDVSFLRIARCGAVATAIGILLLPVTSSILIGEYSSTTVYSSKGSGNLARIRLSTQARTCFNNTHSHLRTTSQSTIAQIFEQNRCPWQCTSHDHPILRFHYSSQNHDWRASPKLPLPRLHYFPFAAFPADFVALYVVGGNLNPI